MNAWVASVWLLQFEDFTKKRSAWEMQRLQNLDSKRSDLFWFPLISISQKVIVCENYFSRTYYACRTADIQS